MAAACSAHIASASTLCAHSAEEAARSFVRLAIEAPRNSVLLLEPRSLKQLRARLDQLLDDRYAPDSAVLRERLFGQEWPLPRLRSLSDDELIGLYLAAGAQRRAPVDFLDLNVVRTKPGYSGEDITVLYRFRAAAKVITQERTFRALSIAGCWHLDVPDETWDRLEQISKHLKESRSEPQLNRQGQSRVRLQVAAASDSPSPDMRETPRRATAAPWTVWVSASPLVTEIDVIAASANWDCEAPGLGPEDPAVRIYFADKAAQSLQAWTERNIDAMLAVVIDGEAVTFARVAGAFGRALSVCLPGSKLEDAETLARALTGTGR